MPLAENTKRLLEPAMARGWQYRLLPILNFPLKSALQTSLHFCGSNMRKDGLMLLRTCRGIIKPLRYNFLRPHDSLGGKTPDDVYQGRMAEIV